MNAATAMGVHMEVSAFPTMLIVSFGTPQTEADAPSIMSKHETLHFGIRQSLNCSKLQEYGDMAVALAERSLPVEEVVEKLKEIENEKPHYPMWLQIVCFAIASGGSPLLFYGGSWADAGFSTLLGVVVGLLSVFFDHTKPHIATMSMFISSLVVGFLSYAASTFIDQFCPFATSLSGILWLLPGLQFATAVSELASRSLISGTSRFFYAIVVALQLGFGLAIGSRLVLWRKVDINEVVTGCKISTPGWLIPLWLLLMCESFNVLLNLRWRQHIPSTINAIVAYASSYTLAKVTDGDTVTAISAFCVGISSIIIAKVIGRRDRFLVTVFSGICMLVPGGLATRAATSIFTARGASGVEFGVGTATTGFAITMGLYLAKAVSTAIFNLTWKPTGQVLIDANQNLL